MNAEEFDKKLASIPAVKPDELDLAMIAEAERENDGTTVSLEQFMAELEGYSGKVVLRMPRSLHKALKEKAAIEGVSLNQYLLYKLAQ